MRRLFTIITTLFLVAAIGVALQAQVRITINSPASLAGEVAEFTTTTGWSKLVLPDEALTADVIVVESELTGGMGETPQMGCGPSMAGQYDGKVAIARRGVCAFSAKVQNAVDAGAEGVFIVNNAPGLITMSAAAGVYIDVYVHMISQILGDMIISAIEGGETVNVTIERLPVDDSLYDLIWGGAGDPNSEFVCGMHEWTVEGISCFGGGDSLALWTCDIPPVTRGGCGSGAIQSPSVYNGAMSFDSDYLNDAGQACPPVGGGPCPAPHRGELISPVIDVSGVEGTIAVKFNQNYRRFSGPSGQTEAATFLEVTNDGGQSWHSFGFNNDVAVNAATASTNIKIINITSVASGHDEIQIKFVFNGEYYYWQVDDVYLIRLPDNSLALNNVFYPPISKHIPMSQAAAEVFSFRGLVSNNGGNLVEDAYLKVEIVDGEDNVYFEDSTLIEPLNVGDLDSLVEPEFTFVPDELEPGEYFIRYTVLQPGTDDFDPGDNSRTLNFFITDDTYWQSGELRVWNRVAVGGATDFDWGYGSYFSTNANSQVSFIVPEVEVSFAGQTGPEELEGQPVEIYILELISGFFASPGTTLNDTTNTQIAEGFFELTLADERQVVAVPVYSFNEVTFEEETFVMENGKDYFVMAIMQPGVYMGWDNQYPSQLQDFARGQVFYDGIFHNGNFANTVPFIKLNLMISSTNEQELPETFVQMFPNPASHTTNVSLDFEKNMDVTIALTDINGRVINFRDIPNVKEHLESIDLSALAAGTYIVHVATPDGVATRKIMVVK